MRRPAAKLAQAIPAAKLAQASPAAKLAQTSKALPRRDGHG